MRFVAHMIMSITLRCLITRSDAKPTVSGYDNQTKLQSQKWKELKQDLTSAQTDVDPCITHGHISSTFNCNYNYRDAAS